MNWQPAAVGCGVLIGIVLSAWLGALTDRNDSDVVHKNQRAIVDSRLVSISDELAARAKLQTKRVSRRSLPPTLSLVGSVVFDANKVAEVGARIDGRITQLMVVTGDKVREGQPLVEIESAGLGLVISELLGARANLVAAEHHESRQLALMAQQLATGAVVERARAEVRALRAQVQGIEQRLIAMGLHPNEVAQAGRRTNAGRIVLRSPIAGEVVARRAVLGQVVDPTVPIVQVADLDYLWVELDVFEQDLGRVAEGNAAQITSETHPGVVFFGKVTYVDATIDLATRAAGVRVTVDNRQRLLRPGQFVTARLDVSGGKERSSIIVPSTAVLSVEGDPSVFLVMGDGKYFAREVELGTHFAESVEVTRGLLEGDTIVTQGAFALKSELLR